MPTYEYECKDCGHGFETFQAMSDDPIKDCPKCGKDVRRLIFGGAGVIFKGSGFYVTDKGKSSKTESKSTGNAVASGIASSGASTAPSPACANCPANTGSSGCGAASSGAESKTA